MSKTKAKPACKFTVTGTFDSREVSVTWDNGTVTGDAATIKRLKQVAKALRKVATGEPVSMNFGSGDLADPWRVESMLARGSEYFPAVIEAATVSDAEWPQWDLPEGAIA